MNKRLTYNIENNVLFLFTKGDYSAQEFIDLLKTALNDSRLPQKFGVIVDARHSIADHTIADIKPIEDELNKWKENIVRLAIVVSTDLHFGITRQSSVYAEFANREVEPFRDMESAIDWVRKKTE
jgi:hypothetical protein